MAQKVGGMFVSLAASSARFDRDMKKARDASKKSANGINNNFNRARKSTAGFSNQIGKLKGSLIAVAGPAALGYLIKKSIDAADNIAKTADAIGITTDMLQELQFAADLAGISQDTLNSALKAFTKRVGEARSDTGTLVTILKKMDEELLNNVQSSKSAEDAFDLIINAAADMENPLDRAALLAAAFGRTAGVEMANMIKGGTQSLDDMRQKARDLGLVIEEDLLRNAEQAKDALTIMGRVVSVNLTRAVIGLAPQITNLATKLSDGLPAIFMWVNKFLEWTGAIDKSRIDEVKESIAKIADSYLDTFSKDIVTFSIDKDMEKGLSGGILGMTNFAATTTDASDLTDQLTLEQIALQNQLKALEAELADLEKQESERFEKAMAANKAMVEGELDLIKTKQEAAQAEKQREADLKAFNTLYQGMTTDQFELERQQLEENLEKWKEAGASQTEMDRYEAEERKRISLEEYEYKLGLANQLMNAVSNLANSWLEMEKAQIQKKLAADEQAAVEEFNINKKSIEDKYTVEGELTEKGLEKMATLEQGHQAEIQNMRDQAIREEKKAAKALKPIRKGEVIMNTAVAIMKAWKDYGWPVGVAIGALVAAAGAAQIATIDAQPFGKGGIVNAPTYFQHGGEVGLMGEAGAEAILPLTRMAGGDLGVQASGGQSINLKQNFYFYGITEEQFINSKVIPQVEDAARKGITSIMTKS